MLYDGASPLGIVIPCAAQRETVRCRHGNFIGAFMVELPCLRSVILCRSRHGMTPGKCSSGFGITAWLAALLVAGTLLWVSAAVSNQASEPDQSFQQLFMWG